MDDKKLFSLIKKSLKINQDVNDKSSDKNIEEWDSLGHLSILSALDKATKGKASKIKNLSDATSVQKIKKILKQKNL